MWTCKRCTINLKFSDCQPDIDDLGVYFLCPRCGYRNKLARVGPRDGPLDLAQIDE